MEGHSRYLIDEGVSWDVFVDLGVCWEVEKNRWLFDVYNIHGEMSDDIVYAICCENCNIVNDDARIRWRIQGILEIPTAERDRCCDRSCEKTDSFIIRTFNRPNPCNWKKPYDFY